MIVAVVKLIVNVKLCLLSLNISKLLRGRTIIHNKINLKIRILVHKFTPIFWIYQKYLFCVQVHGDFIDLLDRNNNEISSLLRESIFLVLALLL